MIPREITEKIGPINTSIRETKENSGPIKISVPHSNDY